MRLGTSTSIMALRTLLLVFFTVHFARAEDNITVQNCDFKYKFVTTNEPVNITQTCKEKPCLVKCCPDFQVLLWEWPESSELPKISCRKSKYLKESNQTNLEDRIKIYNSDIERKVTQTKKKVKDFNLLYSDSFTKCSQKVEEAINIFEEPIYRKLITEDGRLRLRRINFRNQWMASYEMTKFCIGYEEREDEAGNATEPQLVYLTIAEESASFGTNDRALFSTYGMIVSVIFMLIVLIVYSLLRELQNLAGMMLMAYLASFIVFFILRIIHVYWNDSGTITPTECIVMTILVYFTSLSTFSWMNIMSFDMWWTLRGIRKQRPIHSRGTIVKFLWYCLYAWGVPLLLTLFVIVVDNVDMSSVPDFVVPHVFFEAVCYFIEDSHPLYVSTPLGIMIVINICCFLMTAYNIWRVRQGVTANSAGNSKINKKDEYRFMVYMKLSLVMGVSWILEVMGNLVMTEHAMWYVTDLYNALTGLFLFVTFVCKRTIFLRLCNRFNIENDFVHKMRARSGDTMQISEKTQSTNSTNNRQNDTYVDSRPDTKC